jgi:PAN domain
MVKWSNFFCVLLAFLESAKSAEKTTAEERAECQCSVDGNSANRDALFFAKLGKLYPSENIEDGGPYQFIGCGAHKFYRDRAYQQIAGYPWRFCYTFGGTKCRITETTRKHALNVDTAWRFCDGDYDCKAEAHSHIPNGTVLDVVVLNDNGPDEILQDWTNCCQLCRETTVGTCLAWDFDVATMECRLFSESPVEVPVDGTYNTVAPMRFSGTPGFDDAPAKCWFRNKYDTCRDNFRRLFITAMCFLPIGVLCLILAYHCARDWLARTGWSDDLTLLPTRRAVRSISTKHGTSQIDVDVYSVDMVYKYKGVVRRDIVTREGVKIEAGKRLYYHKDGPLDHSGGIKIQQMPLCNVCCPCGFLFLFIGSTILLILSLQVYQTDGGRLQAHYVLPSDVKQTWAALFYVSAVLITLAFMAMAAICVTSRHYLEDRFIREENTYYAPQHNRTHPMPLYLWRAHDHE